MPFTPAHAAAAAPLWYGSQRRLVLSALVVGTICPDFEYFVRLSTTRTIGHSAWGIVVIGLPVSLLVLCTLHYVVKRPMLMLLPRSLDYLARVGELPFPLLPPRRFVNICVAILLGAFSHVAWDSFTHLQGWSVQHFPVLQASLIRWGGRDLAVFKLLQYLSGLGGVAFLGWWLCRWADRQPRGPAPATLSPGARTLVLTFLGLFSLSAGLANAVRLYLRFGDQWRIEVGIVGAIIGAITGFCVASLLYGAVNTLSKQR